MTPRVPRGFGEATEPGEGLWMQDRAMPCLGWMQRDVSPRAPLDPLAIYIRRTDPNVPADPNEALRMEDEAARLVDHSPEAVGMVPGMMLVASCDDPAAYVPLNQIIWHPDEKGRTAIWNPCQGHDTDSRTPEQFAAAYTTARDHTVRHDERLREEVRREMADHVGDVTKQPTVGDGQTYYCTGDCACEQYAVDSDGLCYNCGGDVQTLAQIIAELSKFRERDMAPKQPDLAEWPGRADVPPDDCRDIEVLTPFGAVRGDYFLDDWRVGIGGGDLIEIDPADVLAWRELPCAVVVDGRAVGVTHG